MRIKRVMLGMALGVGTFIAAPLQAAEDNPAIIKQRLVETVVSPDGLHTRTLHMEIQVANAAAAMQVGQQFIQFSESMEDLEVVEAYTAKANGERIPIGPNAVYTQQAQGSAQFPLFDDQRQKVIVFPNVAGGDTVAFTVRWIAKQARIPGQFTYSSFFPKSVVYNEVRETTRTLSLMLRAVMSLRLPTG